MDAELKNHLEAMESRLQGHTDQKLEAMESRLRDYTDDKLKELELRLREHTEAVETRLLSEFWKWARTSDMKARHHGTTLAAMDERLMSVEERLMDLERRRPRNGA